MAAGEQAKQTHRRVWMIITACTVCAVLIAGGAIVVLHDRANSASATAVAPPPPLTVVATAPIGTNVAAGSTLSVLFSTALAPGSPMPTLTPPIDGQWAALSPSMLEYQATGPLVPGTTETITIPGGPTGVVGSMGQHLTTTQTATFTVAQGSVLRLQELLAL